MNVWEDFTFLLNNESCSLVLNVVLIIDRILGIPSHECCMVWCSMKTTEKTSTKPQQNPLFDILYFQIRKYLYFLIATIEIFDFCIKILVLNNF
jgi:hypothetical protein